MTAMMIEDTSTPVVVMGCFRHGGLGVTRSLGSLGVPIYCVDRDPLSPAFFSKYCHKKNHWDLLDAPKSETVHFLLKLGRSIGRHSVLIPMDDVGAMLIAEHANVLSDCFLFPKPRASLVRSLCSKKEMYQLARKHGVTTPETAFPQSRTDVLQYLETARFPILLKPIYNYVSARGAQSMHLVHSQRELLEHYDATEDSSSPNLMLQEFIPGGDETWTFNGYFDSESNCKVAFTGKKIRNYPPGFGQGSLGVCLKNEEVERTTVRFMKDIAYKGCLDIGYRYDARDGCYKVNDVNPRIGAMFRLFVGKNGIDVARALYQDMTEQPITAAPAQDGRKWMVEFADTASSIHYYRRGDLSFRQWLNSLRGVQETSYVRLDDLGPVAAVLLGYVRNSFRRVWSSAASIFPGRSVIRRPLEGPSDTVDPPM